MIVTLGAIATSICRPAGRSTCIVLPAFLSSSREYDELAEALRELGHRAGAAKVLRCEFHSTCSSREAASLRPPPPCCRPCRGAAGIPRRLAACSQWRQLRLVPAAGSSGCGQTLAHWRVQSAARSHSRGRVSRGLAGAAGAWAMPVRWWAVPPGGRATPAARRPCVSSRRHLHCPSAGEASGSQSLPLWQQAVGAKGATPGSSTSLLCVCRGRVPPRPPGVLPDHPRHAPPVLGALSIRPGPGA